MACDTVTQLVARLSSHIAAREEQRRDEARSKEQGAGRFVGFYVRGGAGYRRMESAAFFWGGGAIGGGRPPPPLLSLFNHRRIPLPWTLFLDACFPLKHAREHVGCSLAVFWGTKAAILAREARLR